MKERAKGALDPDLLARLSEIRQTGKPVLGKTKSTQKLGGIGGKAGRGAVPLPTLISFLFIFTACLGP